MRSCMVLFVMTAVMAICAPGVKRARSQDHFMLNSVGMVFVRIAPGTFTMGSPEDEPHRDSTEIQHRVTISKPFYMQTTEVTVKQWRTVMGGRWRTLFGRHKGADGLPVTQVCRHEIEDFIAKLNQLGEGRYRLPTEAQWEYAARAGATTAYSWGDRINCSRAMYANKTFRKSECLDFSKPRGLPQDSPAPVKSYPPNAWGLYDMHGNVWEWVYDWYAPYGSSDQTDPQGPASGDMRVRRGGSWFSGGDALRSANRAFGHPASRLRNTGFRVIRLAD